MHRPLEKQLAAEALALGNSGEASGLGRLLELLSQPSVQVRRLAASAIGKLAGVADSRVAVSALMPVLADAHPQVRQYAVKALKAYGADAESALGDLRDLSANESEKEYNRRDAKVAIEVIEEALRIREKQAVHHCQRCGADVDADEYARSQRAFQRCFCDRCFDEVYLERRNFDTRVELSKTIRAGGGTLVQSRGERRIADWLSERGLTFRYDERMRIVQGYAVRPDFYLPEFDLYIEYWGMDTTDYKIGMLKKKKLYQQEGKCLVSIHRDDTPKLEEVLEEKLARYIQVPAMAATRDDDAGKTSEGAGELSEEGELSVMFEVLGRYRETMRLMRFRQTGRATPDTPIPDEERLARTRTFLVKVRRKLARAFGEQIREQDPPLLSGLLQKVTGMRPTVRGKEKAVRDPLALLWKLTHASCFDRAGLSLSEATACLLWYWRACGQLDAEDPSVPGSDLVSVVVLYVASAPEQAYRQALSITRKLLTPFDAP